MRCGVDDPVHVQRLVLIGLVLLSPMERSLEHEPPHVVDSEEPDDLLLDILPFKPGHQLWLGDGFH